MRQPPAPPLITPPIARLIALAAALTLHTLLPVLAGAQRSNVTALGPMLYADDEGTRLNAARRLATIGEEALPMLREALTRSEPGVADAAAISLAQMRRPRVAGVDALAAAMHPNRYESMFVADALATLGAEAAPAIPALVATLDSADANVRMAAAAALGAIGAPAAHTLAEASLAMLAILGWGGDWFEVFADVPAFLETLGAAGVPALTTLLSYPTEGIRAAAAAALARLGEPPAGESGLAQLLTHPEPHQRIAAAVAVSAFGDAIAVSPLERERAADAMRKELAGDQWEATRTVGDALGRLTLNGGHLRRYPRWRSHDGTRGMLFLDTASSVPVVLLWERSEGSRTGVAVYEIERGTLRLVEWLGGRISVSDGQLLAGGTIFQLSGRSAELAAPYHGARGVRMEDFGPELVLSVSGRHVRYLEQLSTRGGYELAVWNDEVTVAAGSSRRWDGHDTVVVATDGRITTNVRIRSGPATSYDPVYSAFFGGTVVPERATVLVLARTVKRERIGEWNSHWLLVQIPAMSGSPALRTVWLYGEFVDLAAR